MSVTGTFFKRIAAIGGRVAWSADGSLGGWAWWKEAVIDWGISDAIMLDRDSKFLFSVFGRGGGEDVGWLLGGGIVLSI